MSRVPKISAFVSLRLAKWEKKCWEIHFYSSADISQKLIWINKELSMVGMGDFIEPCCVMPSLAGYLTTAGSYCSRLKILHASITNTLALCCLFVWRSRPWKQSDTLSIIQNNGVRFGPLHGGLRSGYRTALVDALGARYHMPSRQGEARSFWDEWFTWPLERSPSLLRERERERERENITVSGERTRAYDGDYILWGCLRPLWNCFETTDWQMFYVTKEGWSQSLMRHRPQTKL